MGLNSFIWLETRRDQDKSRPELTEKYTLLINIQRLFFFSRRGDFTELGKRILCADQACARAWQNVGGR